MKRVALTGGIGSGKSYVSRIFANLGVPVFDSDQVAKHLMQNHPALQAKIQAWGQAQGQTLYPHGQLDRSLLASIIFNNEAKKQEVEALVHPLVQCQQTAWFNFQDQWNYAYAIVESALIFETEMNPMFDLIINVAAPMAVRYERVSQRSQLTPDQFDARVRNQLDDAWKALRSHFVLTNDGTTDMNAEVQVIHELLTTKK